MDEKKAKRLLRRLRRFYTSGSVLHLLAELHGDDAAEARRAKNHQAYEQHKLVEHALIVVGMGVDAALPT